MSALFRKTTGIISETTDVGVVCVRESFLGVGVVQCGGVTKCVEDTVEVRMCDRGV